MAQDRKLTSEEKWRALSPAGKAIGIFFTVTIVAGAISGLTAKQPHAVSNSLAPPVSASSESSGSTSFSKADAFAKCTPAIEARINWPETIDYNLLDTTFVEDGDKARFTITGTAENNYGASAPIRAQCHFNQGKIASVDVSVG